MIPNNYRTQDNNLLEDLHKEDKVGRDLDKEINLNQKLKYPVVKFTTEVEGA